LYEVIEDDRTIVIHMIDHRKDIYRR
jgi:mRNA-degrading endonuclease RelE of RelBE toxin-antitoxin system